MRNVGSMVEIEEELKNFYSYFLRSVQAITDNENPGKCWSVELVEDFFSPYECVITWKTLSEQQRYDLQLLADMIDGYEFLHHHGKKKTDDEICNDLEWDKIREFARALYQDLKHVKYVP